MPRFFKHASKKLGQSPGTLVYIGKERVETIHVTVIDYDEDRFEAKEVKHVEDCFPFKETPTVTWINLDGIHEPEIVEKIGTYFEVHPLVLEDILHTDQRPKMEDFDTYLVIIFKMLYFDDEENEIKSEQVSLILGPNVVISFQETPKDVFDSVRERIRGGKGRIRKMGADYLAYALIDAVVDHYFVILEKLGERIEELEDEVVSDPRRETMQEIHALKRELIFLRKSVWPLREVISALTRGESKLVRDTTNIYLRDVYDHTIQVIDTIETFRDMVSGMLDTYLSSLSNRMNEVMKVLTIIATIFIPLTFIAGIYGMNFEFMPELKWRLGYFAALFVMLLVFGGMLVFFRRKGWL